MLRSSIAAARPVLPALTRPQTVLRSQLRVPLRPFPAKATHLSRSPFHSSKATTMTEAVNRFASFHLYKRMLQALDYFGTLVFAVSGTVTAGAAGMDILG